MVYWLCTFSYVIVSKYYLHLGTFATFFNNTFVPPMTTKKTCYFFPVYNLESKGTEFW